MSAEERRPVWNPVRDRSFAIDWTTGMLRQESACVEPRTWNIFAG